MNVTWFSRPMAALKAIIPYTECEDMTCGACTVCRDMREDAESIRQYDYLAEAR